MNTLEAARDGDAPIRFDLASAGRLILGRDASADLRLGTEPYLGRRHVELRVRDGRLVVQSLAGSRNPVFFHGAAQRSFAVEPGDEFVIGRTRFAFRATADDGLVMPDAEPSETRTLSSEELFGPRALAARLRLRDLLELPEILSARSPGEFHLHLARLLRMSTGARWGCVADDAGSPIAVDDAGASPGARRIPAALAAAALASAPRPTLHRWSPAGEDPAGTGSPWAICAAVPRPRESPLLLYACGGEAGRPADLEESCRFVGLVADMAARALAVRRLEAMTGRLQRYFSGPVVDRIIASQDAAELEPRVAHSTVMFFDLRGFSKRTESRNEKILEHLDELKHIMTAMTDAIFGEQGVVLHYLGDGIMACWNVPIACEDHVDRACRAALAMVEGLRRLEGGWQCGIGLHTGEVVAGAIGSAQVFSYSVMGAVVNQASRIEGITKIVESPVLATRAVAERVSRSVAVPVRVGRFLPAGMTTALELFELLPPPGSPDRAARFADGLAAFERGEWEAAYAILDPLGPGDRPARYLKSLAEMHRRHPPKDWQGVIELTEK